MKRELHTDSLTVANQLKWQVVSELKAEIEAARRGTGPAPTPTDALLREALAIAAQRARAQTHEEHDAINAAIEARADDIIGRPVEETRPYGGDVEPVYDPGREAQAAGYRALAMGEATPIALHHAEFIAHAGNKARTQGDDFRALKFLMAWCEKHRVSPTVEAITRKHAIRFITLDLAEIAGVESPTTLRKYLNRLSLYWRFLMAREIAETDPFHQGHKLLPKPKGGPEERDFTDAEVSRLLQGPASPQLHDLMRIAALTGARIEAIVDLKVKDCADGLFTFKPQKKETKPRSVPIHPVLAEIIARRTEGRGPEEDVFPEYPAPRNPQRERSFRASNAFTLYRRDVGVDEVIAGRRRSLVNFHSFRRWFITKAEQAGQPEHIIAVVVGHKRQGMTLGRYSAGPQISQARACVEAVHLPT